MIEKQHYSSGV